MKQKLAEERLMKVIAETLEKRNSRGLVTEDDEQPQEPQATQQTPETPQTRESLQDRLAQLLPNGNQPVDKDTAKELIKNLINEFIGDIVRLAIPSFIRDLFSGKRGSSGQNKAWTGKRYTATKHTIDAIIIHCTATEGGQPVSVEEIDRWHRQNGWKGVGYNYVIDVDGTVQTGRPEGSEGAHCDNKGDSNLSYNLHSIGIAYVGGVVNGGKYYDKKEGKEKINWVPEDTRTMAQKRAMITLIKDIVNRYPIREILGHREAGAKKSCPCFDASDEYCDLIPPDRERTPIQDAALKRRGLA